MEPETSPGALSAESPPVALPHPPCHAPGASIRDPWVDVSFLPLLPKETLPLTRLGLLLPWTMTSRRGYDWGKEFRSCSVKKPASLGRWFICGLGCCQKLGAVSLPSSRGVAGRERDKGGAASLNLGNAWKRPEGRLTQDPGAPALPRPVGETAPSSLGSHLPPDRGSPAYRAQGPSAPLGWRTGDDEMAAWAAAHRDGFQALKWAERDERPQEGHFFLNFGARRTRRQGPQPAGLALPPWSPGTADVLTYCSDQRQPPGAHMGLGQGGGSLGISLGLAPRGLPSEGLGGKVPG